MERGPVPKEALAYFRAKQLKPAFDHRDVWKQEHDSAFTVAKAMRFDLLEDIRNGVDEALEQGLTFEQFRQRLTPTLQEKGWWGRGLAYDPTTQEYKSAQLGSPQRLRTIYRTNMRTARAAGQWDRIQRTKRTHPYLLYRLGPSENHREQHASWLGILLPADHEFWRTHFPPNGWGCKCWIRQVSRREAERLIASGRVTTEAPPIETRTWTNKRTGEQEDIPLGIDPGWNYHPGADRKPALQATVKRAETQFKKTIEKPLPAGHVWPQGTGAVFSTAKGVTQEGVEDVLSRVPGIQGRLGRIQEAMERRPVKALFVKASEMSAGNKAAKAIEGEVEKFLGDDWPAWSRLAYTTSRASRTNGFTFTQGQHVVTKVKAATRLSKANPEHLAAGVREAIALERTGRPLWSVRASVDSIADVEDTGPIATFVHELGHQIHFAAGTPRRPVGAPRLTIYGNSNDYEWHADHFAAWLLNRDALAEWSPQVAEYFDDLVETAIKNN